jgi:hypothetical protein
MWTGHQISLTNNPHPTRVGLSFGVIHSTLLTNTSPDIPMTHAEAYLLLRRGKFIGLLRHLESHLLTADPEFTRVLVSEHRVSLTMVTRPSLCFRIKGKNKILQEVETALEARRKVRLLPCSSPYHFSRRQF